VVAGGALISLAGLKVKNKEYFLGEFGRLPNISRVQNEGVRAAQLSLHFAKLQCLSAAQEIAWS
jgi:hypothetical protein